MCVAVDGMSGVAVSSDGVIDGVGDRVAVGLRARVPVERPGPDAVEAVAVDADMSVVVFLEYQRKTVPLRLRPPGVLPDKARRDPS